MKEGQHISEDQLMHRAMMMSYLAVDSLVPTTMEDW